MSGARSIESFAVGQSEVLAAEITPELVSQFARLSGDDAPLHTDPEFAHRAGLPGTIAHGALLGSLVSRLVGTRFPGPGSMLQRMDLTFRHPVSAPSRIEIRATVKQVSVAVRSVRMTIDIRDPGGRTVATGETSHTILPIPGQERPLRGDPRASSIREAGQPIISGVALENGRVQPWRISDLTLAELLTKAADVPPEQCTRRTRVAVVGDCATQNYVAALQAALKLGGCWPETYEGGFGQTFNEILDPASGLYAHRPAFVVLINSVQSLQDRWSVEASHRDFVGRVVDEIRVAWHKLRQVEGITVIQHNFCLPLDRPFGNFTLTCDSSFTNAVWSINAALLDAARQDKGVVIFDTDYQASYFGKRDWLSERFWCHARQLCSPKYLPPLVKGIADVIQARLGNATKCVILDLDNTLWSGILADDGVEGLALGDSGVGLAFQRFQRILRHLRDRGVLLAVCSKNHEETARHAFRTHPEMVLREEDLVAFIANYDNKAQNIMKIREALDIGFDSMVFLDDSPFERDLVRTAIPQIQVPDLPEDPADFASAMARWNLFETSDFTAEDQGRLRMYQENVKRIELRDQFADLDTYLSNLGMVGEVAPFNAYSLPRVSQLVQRSNQFNLMTWRHSEARLLEMACSPGFVTFSVRLLDRLGDNGIVVCVIGEIRGSDFVIDTWVMSCRVLGRKVEHFTLQVIMEKARQAGCTRVIGQYRKTSKNAMVADLYQRLGFTEMPPSGEIRLFMRQVAAYTPVPVPITLGSAPRTT